MTSPRGSRDGSGRRLLIVSYHAPPSRAVGGLRWWGLAKHLARRGWQVAVLTEGDPHETLAPDGVRVVRVPRRRTAQDRYQAWRAGHASTADSGGPVSEGSTFDPGTVRPAGILSSLRTELSESLRFPDMARGWLVRALVAGRELVREFDPTVILSSGPPHSMHALARSLGAGAGTRYWMDYRDPWRTSQPSSPFGGRVLGWVEERLVRSAVGLLATTPELVSRLQREHPGVRVEWLPNGVDVESLPERIVPAPGELEVLHLGSLYGARDPSALLEGMRSWLRMHPQHAGRTHLRFIGDVEAQYGRVLEEAQRGDLGPHLITEPSVARGAALDALRRTHLAIVLAVRQPDLVPAKLYESVAMGVPTLVITEAGSASGNAAARVGALQCQPEDHAGIARVFEAARAGTLAPRVPGGAPVTHQELAGEADRLLR